ncbi:MAG: 4Fe-4S binding protein [Anaerolineaceae bacterium]
MSALYGKGILDSLRLVFKHFIDSYRIDLKDLLHRNNTQEKVDFRSSSSTSGLFTVEYPEEKLAVPEEFRFLPFLVFDITDSGEEKQRCTACGTCARVCPSQCIWIERAKDPETGKPVLTPANFWIDADMCMNCGLCAEFCPFDAIRMDHNFELASSSRKEHVFDLKKLSKPAAYYQKIRPNQYTRESAAREEKKKQPS